MKTKEEYELAIKEISDVCGKHGVFLMGTCHGEGFYGEITIGVTGDSDSHCFLGPETLGEGVDVNEYDNFVSVERVGKV